MERDVVAAFNAELASIYESRPPISKNKIVDITKAALKAIKFYKHVVFSVEKFLGKCKAEYKIPCLYVMDSILRQSKRQFKDKDVFVARFAKNFENTLVVLLQCSPSDRLKIARTLNLWEANGVFPPDKIAQYRTICENNGLETDKEAVERAVKGENADLSIYEKNGEKERKEHRHHHHHHHRNKENENKTDNAKVESIIEGASEDIPSGGVSEAFLLSTIQNQMFDMGTTVERDLILLRQIHSMILEKMKEKLDKDLAANKQVSVKKLLSSNFDYSDDEENEEEKEEIKPPPVPTQEELDRLAETLVAENAMGIRAMHGERMVKLQAAALEAKRAEAQRAAHEAIQQEQERERDAAVAAAQKVAAAQQQATANVSTSILGSGPGNGPQFTLPPGIQGLSGLGGLSGIPGLPQVSLASNALGLLQQNNLDNQMKMLNNMLGNPLMLAQAPPSQLNIQQNSMLAAQMRLNQQLAFPGGPPDLQALLSQPPPNVPTGMPPPQFSQQSLTMPPPSMTSSLPPPSMTSSMIVPPPTGVPPPINNINSIPPPFSPSRPPPNINNMNNMNNMIDIQLSQSMMAAKEEQERDRREEDRGRRKRSRDRERGDRDRRDADRDRSDRRDKEKKRKRSRSRERRRSKDRDYDNDKDRRKLSLPSHSKESSTLIASCTVWLGRLPQITEDELRSEIPELCSAIRLQLMSSRACAYVSMKDRKSAVKLLDKAKGARVKDKWIKCSWAAGNGTKNDKWKSYWDEDKGVTWIPHNDLPLDSMNNLCDGGWLDVNTLPIHLRGIIDENGCVIDQSKSTSSTTVNDESSSSLNNSFDLGQVQLPPSSIPTPAMPPNNMNPFAQNMGGHLMMPPPPMIPPGAQHLMGLGLHNGSHPPFIPSPIRGGMGGGRGGGYMGGSSMRGGGDWRGGRGRGGMYNNRGRGGGGWMGGQGGHGPPSSIPSQSFDHNKESSSNNGRRTNSRWSNDETTVTSTTTNDETEIVKNNEPNSNGPEPITKIDTSDDMEME